MTWATHAQRLSRIPAQVVEIDLDWIGGGSTPAVDPVNPDGSLCFGTPATTSQGDDLPLTTRTRRFMTATARPVPELGAIPCLGAVRFASEEVRIGRGLGHFGQVTIDLVDFVDDDRREDPFFDDASRDAIDHSAGTYFGKLLARNPYWTGRALRVIEGWLTDGVWHPNDTITHSYLIRDVQGPSGGRLLITAAGPLQILNLNAREAPAPSEGVLVADLDELEQEIALADPVTANDYPAAGWVRIGDEVCAFTRDGVDLVLDRAAFGTTAETHSAGDGVQLCLRYDTQPITDIVADLLTTYGGVDPSLLALDEWAEEQAQWLSLYQLTGIVSQPSKVLEVVQELLEAAACILWWDETRGQVRLRAVRPAVSPIGTWGDRYNLLSPPVIKRDLTDRVSRTDMMIDLRSAAGDPKDASSYRLRLIGTSLGDGITEHQTPQVRLLASRWFSVAQVDLAARATYQTTAQLRDGRQTIQVEVAAKDSARQIGDVINLRTRDIVDTSGQPVTVRCIVIRRDPLTVGSRYRYVLERVPFAGRYAYFTATDTPAYADAADYQRDPGAFFAGSDGTVLGASPYQFG